MRVSGLSKEMFASISKSTSLNKLLVLSILMGSYTGVAAVPIGKRDVTGVSNKDKARLIDQLLGNGAEDSAVLNVSSDLEIQTVTDITNPDNESNIEQKKNDVDDDSDSDSDSEDKSEDKGESSSSDNSSTSDTSESSDSTETSETTESSNSTESSDSTDSSSSGDASESTDSSSTSDSSDSSEASEVASAGIDGLKVLGPDPIGALELNRGFPAPERVFAFFKAGDSCSGNSYKCIGFNYREYLSCDQATGLYVSNQCNQGGVCHFIGENSIACGKPFTSY
ncbi:hypothetical protein AX774_g7955 [Zancudomyces culisetae]|uniref:Carbohydrate-binding module family 19 domain-containing protein n=1 Tax=Zancudomyces culisetae TaxID=1213189 RepID=A0A1R1PCK8_ZANCU|nr:hypothetical protein AX774_g7955 [Zancudomyces culisetae]|eukprot:OMH78649.1 hypothetical protein AX774_g7955 [Zancudomyces culisetae]